MRIILCSMLIVLVYASHAQDSTRYSLEVSYRYEDFIQNETFRSYTSVQLGRKFADKHDLFVQAIYQNRSGEPAWQGVVDFYPSYKKGYMFYSFRYANSILFPRITAISEVYRSVFKNQEFSVGLRYLQPVRGYNLYIVTGTYGIYYGNWFTYARPMLNIMEDGVSWSGMLVTRRYFGIGTSYIEAMILRGNDAGTTRPIGSIENSFGNDQYFLRLKGQVDLGKGFILSAGGDYSGIFVPTNGGDREINIWAADLTIKKVFE